MRCGVPVAPLRREPDDGAEQVTQALFREPLRVEERHGGWARVMTLYDYPGWVRAESLEEGEGELPPSMGKDFLARAHSYLGAPYEWGGMTAAGIDCSGLVHVAFRETGLIVPRDSWQQEANGTHVNPGSERPGDLVTYGNETRADHIAFLLGSGRILHATARDGLGVVDEPEPHDLATRRRAVVRFAPMASRLRDTSKAGLADRR